MTEICLQISDLCNASWNRIKATPKNESLDVALLPFEEQPKAEATLLQERSPELCGCALGE